MPVLMFYAEGGGEGGGGSDGSVESSFVLEMDPSLVANGLGWVGQERRDVVSRFGCKAAKVERGCSRMAGCTNAMWAWTATSSTKRRLGYAPTFVGAPHSVRHPVSP